MKLNIKIDHHDVVAKIVGPQDRNLNVLRQYFSIKISINENEIVTDAKENIKELLENIFKTTITLIENNIVFNERDLIYIIKVLESNGHNFDVINLYKNRKLVVVANNGKPVFPKTFTQKEYIEKMDSYDLVFGVGPAGTGKTYLAVAYATALLKANKIKKIILTRPVVEAGESLGFLPGDIKEKIDPYLIPLYDSLYEFLGKETTDNLILKGVIEIAPLAYMRGRTLENAFVILDEAQNTTSIQMKMFLTRLGFNSKMLITGDPSQIDLRGNQLSGLKEVMKILDNMDDIKFVNFDKIDVIRNPLVQKILEHYDEN